jgi:hypothetical protein
LPPSDLSPFGKVKITLIGAAFSDESEHCHGVRNVVSGISPDELEVIFANWVARLDICIQRGESMWKKRNPRNKEPSPHFYLMR